MTSGLATLILYAYLGIVRHRCRKGRASPASVKRASFAVEVAFSAFLLALLITTLYNAFRAEPWVQHIAWIPGVVDFSGAVSSVVLAVKAERIQKNEIANKRVDHYGSSAEDGV